MPEDKKICAHAGTRGGNTDVQCKNRAKVGDYCVKHKKRKKANLANDDVLNDKTPKEQVAAPTTPYSVWKITLNSQKDYTKMTDANKLQFKNALSFIFNDEDIVKYLTDRTNPKDAKKNIKKLKIDFYLEVGEKQGRLHAHGLMELEHTGNYTLELQKIKGVISKLLGSGVYFNAVGSGDPQKAWADYMAKGNNTKKVDIYVCSFWPPL